MSFRDQGVWITGASSGIGEALAYELARQGAQLVLSARREAELERVRAACGGRGHLVLPLDLTAPETFPAAVERVVTEQGSLHVLVHNGGVSQRSLARETALEVDRRIFEINFFGTVALTKAVLPTFRAQGHGRFVVVSSLVGHIGTPLRSAYAASKHALHGFFDSLKAEVWGDGIRVTMICPGFVHTQVSINALTGDGSPQGKMDRAQEQGMSAEECARRMARAILRGKDEVLIGGKERFAVYLYRFFPGLFHRLIRRLAVT